jgi:hypothetical protein
MTVTQPLRDEHKELIPHIETLRKVADSVGQASIESLRRGVEDVFECLRHHLIPLVGQVMGAPDATATMSRDHVEVGRLTDELASLRSELSRATLSEAEARALRRVLYGLYALVKRTSRRRRKSICRSSMPGSAPRLLATCSRRWNKRGGRRRDTTGRRPDLTLAAPAIQSRCRGPRPPIEETGFATIGIEPTRIYRGGAGARAIGRDATRTSSPRGSWLDCWPCWPSGLRRAPRWRIGPRIGPRARQASSMAWSTTCPGRQSGRRLEG